MTISVIRVDLISSFNFPAFCHMHILLLFSILSLENCSYQNNSSVSNPKIYFKLLNLPDTSISQIALFYIHFT
jgi:hypothetical protein